MGGESWGIIAKLSSESMRRNRVMQWQLPQGAEAERCATLGNSQPPMRQHASSLPSLWPNAAAYEAGPTRYGLCRLIMSLDHECQVVAASVTLK
jgi:hypothetical protein